MILTLLRLDQNRSASPSSFSIFYSHKSFLASFSSFYSSPYSPFYSFSSPSFTGLSFLKLLLDFPSPLSSNFFFPCLSVFSASYFPIFGSGGTPLCSLNSPVSLNYSQIERHMRWWVTSMQMVHCG